VSAYWQALLSALDGNATDCAAPILLRIFGQTLTSAEMALMTQAVHQGQIRREQSVLLNAAEIQIAMMQYEVLNALRDALAFEVSRTLFHRTRRHWRGDNDCRAAAFPVQVRQHNAPIKLPRKPPLWAR
jgi:hypothetical protein